MAMKVELAIAPINWNNDDMPELGAENTFKQIISEMSLAGFTGTEIGNKYPSDTDELNRALKLRNMRICSSWFSSFILTEPYEKVKADFIAKLDYLAAVGASRVNVSEQSYSIQGMVDVPILENERHIMNDDEWKYFCETLNKLGEVATERGFKLCFHHHMGTVVQTAAETERMMENTEAGKVYLCYDTGHFTFAGEDPTYILNKYVDRIGHVHLKDMRLERVAEAKEKKWSFLDCVRNGCFTVPGDGGVDFTAVFEGLAKGNYEGWMMIEAEQDPAKAEPLEYAIKGREYIDNLLAKVNK